LGSSESVRKDFVDFITERLAMMVEMAKLVEEIVDNPRERHHALPVEVKRT